MDVQALIEEGLEQLDSYDYEKALKTGRKLIELRHTDGFDIAAQALWELGRNAEAVELLEEGVSKAPQVWLLWQLLGNYSSDLEQFERAFECYETALRCPNADTDAIHGNYAVALNRAGRSEEALPHLDAMRGGDAAVMQTAIRSDVLYALARHDEAIAEARRGLALEPEDEEMVAHLHHAIARSLWAQGNRDAALAAAWNAIHASRSYSAAQWLIREIENERSENAREYAMVLCGHWPEAVEGEDRDFIVHYEVIADDEEEAFRLAARFEPELVRASLRVEKVKKRRRYGTKAPKGVYWTSGRAFFPEDDD